MTRIGTIDSINRDDVFNKSSHGVSQGTYVLPCVQSQEDDFSVQKENIAALSASHAQNSRPPILQFVYMALVQAVGVRQETMEKQLETLSENITSQRKNKERLSHENLQLQAVPGIEKHIVVRLTAPGKLTFGRFMTRFWAATKRLFLHANPAHGVRKEEINTAPVHLTMFKNEQIKHERSHLEGRQKTLQNAAGISTREIGVQSNSTLALIENVKDNCDAERQLAEKASLSR